MRPQHRYQGELWPALRWLFCCAGLLCSQPSFAQFIWETRAPFLDPRTSTGVEGAAAAIIGDKVFVSHGFRGEDTATLSEYDIPTDTWTHGGPSLPDAPGIAQSEMGGGTLDGLFYAMAGRNGPVADTRSFDPSTRQWQVRAPMPTARGAPGFASLNGRLYAIGGRDGATIGVGAILDSNEAYDPVSDSWTVLAPLPTAVSDNYATVAINDRIYVFGGSLGGGLEGPTSDLTQIYDPISNTWSLGAPMPTARKAHMAAEICGRVTVFGGVLEDGNNTAITEIYDPISDSWSVGPDLPAPASEIAQGVVGNGVEAYLIGSGTFGAAEPFVFAMVPVTDLTIDVDDGIDIVQPGDVINQTITIANNGTVDAPGLVVVDNFPAELGAVSWTCAANNGASCAISGNGNINETVDLPAGSSVVFSVTATVVLNTPGVVFNEASATTSIGCSFTDNDSNNVLLPEADLQVTLADQSDPIIAGNHQVYTATVTNLGPDTALASVLNLTLPGGVNFISSSGCAEDPSGLPMCSLGDLNVGNSVQVQFSAQVDANAPAATITATAQVGSATGDPNLSNNSDDESTDVVIEADLSVVKSGPPTAVTGSTISYSLDVVNNGPSTASGVILDDSPPAGLSFVSATSPCEGGFPCALGDLAATANINVVVNFAIAANVAPGSVDNSASVSSNVSDPQPANNSSTASTALVALADVSVVKTGPATALAGESLTYRLTVSNNGSSDAQAVVLDDPTPQGLLFDSASAPCAAGFPCNLGLLGAGASVDVDVNFLILADVVGEVINTATASSSTPDPTPANNSASANTTVTAEADVAVDITGPATANAGEVLVYQITVQNLGPSQANAVQLTHPLPTGTTLESIAAPCVGGFPCDLGDMAPASNIAFAVTYRIDSDFSGVTDAQASATSPTPDPQIENNDDAASTTVGTQADLAVVKLGPATAVAGAVVSYDLQVSNLGPSDAVDVVLNDAPGAGLVLLTAAAPCDAGFPCNLGTLAAGANLSLSASFQVLPTAVGAVSNTATVSASSSDPEPANNSSTATTTLINQADVAVVIGVDNAMPLFGDTVRFTITVDNFGPSPSSGVVLNSSLPGGLLLLDFDASQGTYDAASGEWSIGDLALNAQVQLVLDVRVQSGPDHELPVTVSALTSDPNLSNNNASAGLTPQELPAIGAAKRLQQAVVLDPNTVVLNFDLVLENLGNVALLQTQALEDLSLAFPAPVVVSVLELSAAELTVNPGFDGVNDTALLTGADTLPVGAQYGISLMVQLQLNGNVGPFENFIVATAVSPAGLPVDDVSDDGVDPDPDDSGDAGGTGENDPTPIVLALPATAVAVPIFTPWGIAILVLSVLMMAWHRRGQAYRR